MAIYRSETGTFNYARRKAWCMAMDMEHYCQECEEYRTFWKVASTTMHLGTKTKWHCAECDHGFVRIDGEVDTGATA